MKFWGIKLKYTVYMDNNTHSHPRKFKVFVKQKRVLFHFVKFKGKIVWNYRAWIMKIYFTTLGLPVSGTFSAQTDLWPEEIFEGDNAVTGSLQTFWQSYVQVTPELRNCFYILLRDVSFQCTHSATESLKFGGRKILSF